MALEYKAPIMTCDGVEETVEHVWAKYNNTSGAIREHYLHELTLHLLFYPCPRLENELRRAAIENGYKCYKKEKQSLNEIDNRQLVNLVFVSEIEYNKTDFKTGNFIRVRNAVDKKLIYGWIKNYFKPEERKKYEWYALWLILHNKNLIQNKDLTLFARQIVAWFPDLFQDEEEIETKNLAKAIRIYARILGTDPDMWNNTSIISVIHDKNKGAGASEDGFIKIKNLFYSLRSLLFPEKITIKE